MKKIITLLVLILSVTLVFTSCEFIDSIKDAFTGNSSAEGSVVWSSDVKATMIFREETDDISSLYQHIYTTTGIAPSTAPVHSAEVEHEIVIGDTGRQISTVAYSKLDRFADFYSLKADGNSAYLIYADGGSIAVAYTDTYSRYAAIDYLMQNSDKRGFAADGVVVKEKFDTMEYIAEQRNALREEGFVKVEKEHGKQTADALRMVYSLFTEDYYSLIANLYDPGVGGFYYSVSARDNYGYLPDIESTVQALNLIDSSGLSKYSLGTALEGYGQTVFWPNYLSEEMNKQMYEFALSLRAEDGYYYHPQWGQNISSSRKGRDQGWGNRLIAALEDRFSEGSSVSSVSYVSYSTSTGKAITDKLENSRVEVAVSKAVSASTVMRTSAFDDSLVSETDFIAWLDSSLAKDSYSTGNTISSNISSIKKAGLYECLYRYLVDHQFDNGLWESKISYNAINGLMKLCTSFDSEHPFPNARKAIESTIEVMLDPNLEVETICYVYNPWVALYNVIPHAPAQEKAEYKEYLKDNAAMLITDTFNKLAVFKKDDGGFSMNPEFSSQFSQMALAALADQRESDVNATGIGLSTVVNYMLPVLEITAPEMYSEFDSIYFRETLDELQPVIKKTANSKIEVVDFDYYDPSDGEESNGVVLYPATTVQTNIGNDTISEDGYYKWLSTSVVPNPALGASTEDLVLRAIDYAYDYDGNGKTEDGKSPPELAGTGSSIEFMMSNPQAVGECYVFDADLYFNADSASNINDCLAQIIFQTAKGSSTHSAWMNVYAYKKGGETYLRLQENWAGPDKVTDGDVVTGIPTNEWFNLRCETYKIYSGDGVLSIMMKFYLNGEYAGECDGGGYWQTSTGGSYIDRVISSVKFSLYRYSTSEWFFNNVSVFRSRDTYVQEDHPAYINPSEKESYDFETDILRTDENITITNYTKGIGGDALLSFIDKNASAPYETGSYMSICADPEDAANSVLRILTNTASASDTVSSITLNPYIKDKNGEIYVLDYDYYLESESDITSAALVDYSVLYGGRDDDSVFTAITKPNVIGGNLVFRPGNTKSSSLNIKAGSWVKVRTVLDAGRELLCVYVSSDDGATWQNYMESNVILKSEKISKIKISFIATEAENRVQYLDDLSLTIVKELYMTLSDGSEEAWGVPLTATPSDTKIYDFNTDSMVSNPNNVTIFNALGAIDSEINSTGAATGSAGSFFSITTDPKDAANKVLKVLSNKNKDGSEATGSFMTFNPYIQDEGGKILVFDFDHFYAFEGDSAWGGIAYFDVNYSDFSTVTEQAIFKPTLKDADNDGVYEISYRGGNISGDAGAAINTSNSQWIKLRAVIDDEANLLYIYQSTDGGETWDSCRSTPKELNEAEIISMSLRFNAGIAIDRTQYVDNISFVRMNGISFRVGDQIVSFGK